MRKKRFIIAFAFLGLLTACGGSNLPLPYNDEDINKIVNDFSDTEWKEYNVPARYVEFADGEESLTINKGETHTYDLTILPSDATAASLNWSSSNAGVATIKNGLLTAVGQGETEITVSSPYQLFDDIVLDVNVVVPITSFTVVPNGTVECDLNETYHFTPSFTPGDTTYKTLNWEIAEEDQDIATVDNGVVTTYACEGKVTMTVTNDALPGVKEVITLNVYDRTKHVTSITIDGEDSVELGQQIELSAEVLPADADALVDGIKYYSRNTDIATVDEDTGVVTGVATGTANIYAVCELTSLDFPVEVYEINATSVELSEAGPIALSNSGTHQLEWAFYNGEDEVTPTDSSVIFTTSEPSVATVSANGLISVVGKGSATITITHEDSINGTLTDTIVVNVTIVSTAITILGGTSIYNDGETTLTVTITPSGVSDDTVTYTASPEDLVDLTPNGHSVTVTGKGENGTVVITATNGSVSKTHTIEIIDRPVVFEEGDMYIVGSANYSTGTSTALEGGSWLNAKYAYHFTEECESEDIDMDIQYKGTITFNEGDEWRYVYGGVGNSEIWVPGYEEGPYYHIENSGAMTDGSMDYADDTNPESNIVVAEEGSYDLYAKRYVSGWYALYVQKTPTLSVEKTSVNLAPGDTSTIVAHNYTGTLTYSSGNPSVATVSDAGVITAVTVGEALITVSDDLKSVTVRVNVSEQSYKDIYLNANGIFDEADAVPFIHAYASSNANEAYVDLKMELVSGQNIVYSASIPSEYDSLVFVRMPAGSTELNWETKWNQSGDLTHGDYDMWTVSGYDSESVIQGTWSTFDPSIVYDVPVSTTKIINIVSNETYSADGAWFALWAWEGDGEGAFYYGTVENYTYSIEVPSGCDSYIVLRMASGVDASSITSFPSDDQYYNKTDNMTDISGTTFTINGWLTGDWS